MTQPNECSDGALRLPSETGPTSAERVRSLLFAADSLTITTGEHRCVLAGLHSVDAVGRILLWAPSCSCLVTEAVNPSGGGVATVVEVTDVAAVAVRDRVRARVTVHGSLSLSHGEPSPEIGGVAPALGEVPMTALALESRYIVLEDAGVPVIVDPAVLAGAEVDPLAGCEASMLLHLSADHPDAVSLLARLIGPAELISVVRISPLALDRYGIVLRLERRTGHRDVRIPFSARARDVPHAQLELTALLARGARRTRPCHRAATPPQP